MKDVDPDAPVETDARAEAGHAASWRARLQAWRTPLIQWGTPALAFLLVVGLVAAFGGFDRAAPHLGSRAAPKQLIETRYWDVTVHRAGITGQGMPMAVGLRMTIRSKLTESHTGITQEAVMVRMADGTALGASTCFHPTDSPMTSSTFGPLVETDAICAFDFAINGYDFTGEGPLDITVLVLDQAPPPNDFQRTGEPEVRLPPVAHIPMVAEWLVS